MDKYKGYDIPTIRTMLQEHKSALDRKMQTLTQDTTLAFERIVPLQKECHAHQKEIKKLEDVLRICEKAEQDLKTKTV